MTQPFGEGLWKNLQGVSFGPDGEIEAPVRADGDQGIRVGVDAVESSPTAPRRRPGRLSTWWRRRRARRSGQ